MLKLWRWNYFPILLDVSLLSCFPLCNSPHILCDRSGLLADHSHGDHWSHSFTTKPPFCNTWGRFKDFKYVCIIYKTLHGLTFMFMFGPQVTWYIYIYITLALIVRTTAHFFTLLSSSACLHMYKSFKCTQWGWTNEWMNVFFLLLR